ncbi:GNAT family N-acetyltransferase [Paenibacillus aurantius]|uniref:GNAT family N-acetyltransferase n=1 Tax=Paenibacillus aurantius TaxID=2918900 RepID=A0AA96LJR1_9BACL|nr:GNAT family N-acetyltransferase [Paenibacillus aurantius]WNQ13381.1 GNAT family N-acetyltransferase [Paenibacillus aurantius]
MEWRTTKVWDESLWNDVETIYHRSFEAGGRKKDSILRGVLREGLGYLHAGYREGTPAAMAFSGRTQDPTVLVVDYLAVREDLRGQGAGMEFARLLAGWAGKQGYSLLVIEVEAEETPVNRSRIRFWERCGYRPTGYVHQYIWVPEPYRAMYLPLRPEADRPYEGEDLFRFINQFHRKAYRLR